MKKEILGLIPARGGSQGLPGKNIRLLNGIPLIAHTIKHAFDSKYITRVVVVTDCEEIAGVARRFGAETPFKRPAEISGPTSHCFETYKYTVNWLAENEDYRPDILCTMLCTTPFRTSLDIDNCLAKIVKDDCDWSFTVNEIEHHPYRAMIPENGLIKPLFDVDRSILWANRQELPLLYRFNGGVIAGKTKNIEDNDEYNIDNINFSNTKVGYALMETARAIDIDTLEDFQLAEFLMKSKKPQ